VKVSDVMTSEVKTISGEEPLKEAARVMVNAGISGLPVVDDNRKVVGIITEADFVTAEADRSWGRQRRRLLANFLGEAEHPKAKTVADVMTKSPHENLANRSSMCCNSSFCSNSPGCILISMSAA
jgi:CBS-domain-containing membrane protein